MKPGHRGVKGLAQDLTASEWLSQGAKPGPEAHVLATQPWAGVISAAQVCVPLPWEQSPFDDPLLPRPGRAPPGAVSVTRQREGSVRPDCPLPVPS